MSKAKEKTLVLCVDRDNDIGTKTGSKTPILGRDKNVEAASLLATKDPEESDSNAIFGAIQTYDSLSSEHGEGEYEVATITGSELGGVKADKTLRDQLLGVLEKFPAENVILVTDGFSDEEVIPIIQSRVPILSIRRVIVRHSESIEESWALFYRYLKKIVEDPYYSRWFLGVPGVLLIILSLFWYYDQLVHAGIASLLIIGGGLLVKGFSIDKKLAELIFPNPPNLIRLFTTTISIILIGLDFYQTYGSLVERLGDPSGWLVILPIVAGYILQFSVDLLVVASCILLIGLSIYLYFMRDSRIWWTVVGIVASLWMRQIALSASAILLLQITPVPSEYVISLLLMVGLAISTIVATILVTMRLNKVYDQYFKKDESSEKS